MAKAQQPDSGAQRPGQGVSRPQQGTDPRKTTPPTPRHGNGRGSGGGV